MPEKCIHSLTVRRTLRGGCSWFSWQAVHAIIRSQGRAPSSIGETLANSRAGQWASLRVRDALVSLCCHSLCQISVCSFLWTGIALFVWCRKHRGTASWRWHNHIRVWTRKYSLLLWLTLGGPLWWCQSRYWGITGIWVCSWTLFLSPSPSPCCIASWRKTERGSIMQNGLQVIDDASQLAVVTPSGDLSFSLSGVSCIRLYFLHWHLPWDVPPCLQTWRSTATP